MEILSILWLILLFLLSLLAYVSFSVVSLEVLTFLATPLERREDYELKPISPLCPEPERFISILNFCRLFFVFPVVLLLYYWTLRIHILVTLAAAVVCTPLLYVLPVWILRHRSSAPFRGMVQGIGYVLYPLFWLMARYPEVEQKEEKQSEKGKSSEELQEEESKEFKGDILRAISMIEDTTVREVMTPRVEMVCISAAATLDDLHQFFKEHKFSRLPVYKEKIDNVAGIVNVIDLVSSVPGMDRTASVDSIMRPALFVPETKKVFTLLRELRESHAQMAIAIDEYGGTSGLVTLEDLLEEIVGEIEDEYDEDRSEGYREKDGAYIVTGKFPVERMEEIFDLKVAAEDFETISGLIFSLVGRIPIVGEIIRYENLNLEVLEADKRRIHRVRIRQLPRETNAEELL